MSKYESRTIKALLDEIDSGKVILPSMQRDFVWSKEKIYALFDSLMRGYPIGTFMFWTLRKEEYDKFVFNKFVRDYVEQKYKKPHGQKSDAVLSEYEAVLDGQQRITSLYMGIRGKYSAHIRNKVWDDPNSFVDQFLCLNLLFEPEDEDEDYQFCFVEEELINKLLNDNSEYWMKVSDILALPEDSWFNFMNDLSTANPGKIPHAKLSAGTNMINKLRMAITREDNVNYYKASDISLSKIVEIFVRVNDGGQKLDASDLMLSVASGIDSTQDVRLKINDAIDVITSESDSEEPLKVDKEMILTAGLLLTGAESVSLKKESSYSKQQMGLILSKWDEIIDAMANAVSYIEYIGFKCSKLTSKNLIYPIAFYFYKNKLSSNHKISTKKRAKYDRVLIRQFLLRAMINSLFSDSTGKTLLALRDVIDSSQKAYFPLDELMVKNLRKPLLVTVEQINEEILEWKYPDGRIIPLLKEIAKDSSGTVYQADHMWPKIYLLQQKKFYEAYPNGSEEIRRYYKDACHKISNLQLLQPLENQQKLDSLYGDWLHINHPDPYDHYYERMAIPKEDSYAFSDFEVFIADREELLKRRIREALPDEFDVIIDNNNLN